MRRSAAIFPLLLVSLVPLGAQDYYPHHNFTFNFGGALPRADLKSFMTDSGGIGIGYGYRFARYFQADAGLNIIFGAAQVRDFLSTGIGYLRIKDREYMVPLGGRAIAPLAGGRLLLSGGGGAAYLRYTERLNQPSYYYSVDCPICTSRSGWGYYALVNTSYFVGRNFRIGATVQSVRGHTNGEPLGDVPGLKTRDRWINIFGELGFSF